MTYNMPDKILKEDLVVLHATRQTAGFIHLEYFVGVKKADPQNHSSYVFLLTGDKQAGKFYKIQSGGNFYRFIEVDDIYNSTYTVLNNDSNKSISALNQIYDSKEIYVNTSEIIQILDSENTRQKNIAIEKKKIRDEQWLKALAPTNENEKPDKILKEDLVILSIERKSGELTYTEYCIGIQRHNVNSLPDVYLITGNEGVDKFHKTTIDLSLVEEYIVVKEDNIKTRLDVVRHSKYDKVSNLLDIYNANEIYVDVKSLEKCLQQENERQYTIVKEKNENKHNAWLNVIAENKLPEKILKDDLAVFNFSKRVGDISYMQYAIGLRRYNPSIKEYEIFLLTGEEQDTGKFYVARQEKFYSYIQANENSTRYRKIDTYEYEEVPNLHEIYFSKNSEYYIDTNALLECIEKQNESNYNSAYEKYKIRTDCWNSIYENENQEENNNEM